MLKHAIDFSFSALVLNIYNCYTYPERYSIGDNSAKRLKDKRSCSNWVATREGKYLIRTLCTFVLPHRDQQSGGGRRGRIEGEEQDDFNKRANHRCQEAFKKISSLRIHVYVLVYLHVAYQTPRGQRETGWKKKSLPHTPAHKIRSDLCRSHTFRSDYRGGKPT